ncbi:MAG: sulfatase-like hydrolase/transferase [Victivallaceae bacterium]|nr:sulfatase-like hydrolase/transferase [Victivallaceae bacterium]
MRILYLDLDTLRPDHLGCYGYHRNTSPNIDQLAAAGMRFENYYCSDAPCLPSRTALMSGRFGIHTGVVNHAGTCADMRLEGSGRGLASTLFFESLPGMLKEDLGLKTVCISPFAMRHSSWTFYAGFSETHDTGKYGNESGEDVTPTALKWIKDNAGNDNWYLHVNYWDAHTPYRAPEEFGNPFANEPLPNWIDEATIKQHNQMVGPHRAPGLSGFSDKENPKYPRQPAAIRNMDDLRRNFDGYDCGIRYMDGEIGKLLSALKAQGVLDDTVIIISADHGENMGELGIYGEHATADNITCRIPMIIRWPGKTDHGGVDDAFHYNLDLIPTLAEMFEVEHKPSWDGQSFAATLDKGETCGHDYLVVSQCTHVTQRGVRFGDWHYIRTYHDGYYLFPKDMLFNVKNDPHEQHDLADTHPELVKEAVYKLMEWHDQMMASMPEDADPLWTNLKEGGPIYPRGKLAAYCEYLAKTDRAWAIPELKKRHPAEFDGS